MRSHRFVESNRADTRDTARRSSRADALEHLICATRSRGSPTQLPRRPTDTARLRHLGEVIGGVRLASVERRVAMDSAAYRGACCMAWVCWDRARCTAQFAAVATVLRSGLEVRPSIY
jgi:hypothetical protein